MKIPQFLLVFLIIAALLLTGCTDRKPKSSDPSADLPEPTLTIGTTDSSQPNTQESPAAQSESPTTDSSAAETTAPTDLPETSQPVTQEHPATETDPRTPESSAAEPSEPAASSDAPAETETEQKPSAASEATDPLDSAEDLGGQAATTQNTSGADPAETEPTEDSGGIQVEEDPTIYVSGDVELIGGD